MMATTIAICLVSGVASGQVSTPQRIPQKIPQKTNDVRPVYPRESLQAGDEGVVVLELSVTTSGTVGEGRVLWSQCTRLDQAALTAARQWQYERVRVNGKPVPFTVVADVPFRLPPRFKGRAGRVGACKWIEPPKPVTE
jgi:TonB family protein